MPYPLRESNWSLSMLVTLDLTSLSLWPLKGDNLHKQQSIKMKHCRTQLFTRKMRFGLTPLTPFEQVKNKYDQYIWKINIGSYPIGLMKGCISPLEYHYQMLTATMELLKEEPQTDIKTFPSLWSITPVQAAKRKTQSMNRSADLQSINL